MEASRVIGLPCREMKPDEWLAKKVDRCCLPQLPEVREPPYEEHEMWSRVRERI